MSKISLFFFPIADSPNHAEGLAKGYYLNDGIPLPWWHGQGSWIDYFNPAALAWWHQQMDNVLDMGLDGFKCDGTDPYVFAYDLLGGIMVRWHAALDGAVDASAAAVEKGPDFRARIRRRLLSRLSVLSAHQESRGVDLGATNQRLLAFRAARHKSVLSACVQVFVLIGRHLPIQCFPAGLVTTIRRSRA